MAEYLYNVYLKLEIVLPPTDRAYIMRWAIWYISPETALKRIALSYT